MSTLKVEHTALRAKAILAARNNWVINYACYNLLVNLSGLVGYAGGHVLGNFSVTKQRGEQGTGVSAKIKDLKDSIADYQVVLESGGQVIPGGNPPSMPSFMAFTPSRSRRALVPFLRFTAGLQVCKAAEASVYAGLGDPAMWSQNRRVQHVSTWSVDRGRFPAFRPLP